MQKAVVLWGGWSLQATVLCHVSRSCCCEEDDVCCACGLQEWHIAIWQQKESVSNIQLWQGVNRLLNLKNAGSGWFLFAKQLAPRHPGEPCCTVPFSIYLSVQVAGMYEHVHCVTCVLLCYDSASRLSSVGFAGAAAVLGVPSIMLQPGVHG